MQVQLIENLIFTVIVMEADLLKIKDALHIRQLFLPLVVLYILRQQHFPDRVHRLHALGDDRKQRHDRRHLVDHGGKIALVERDIPHLDASFHGKVSGKRQTDHLKDLEDRPADRAKERLHHIELIPFLRHRKELAADLPHLLVLERMRPCHRHKLYHLHDARGGFLHLFSKFPVFILHHVSKRHHRDRRDRRREHEEHKDSLALGACDDQRDPDIEDDIQYIEKHLCRQCFHRLHITHDL